MNNAASPPHIETPVPLATGYWPLIGHALKASRDIPGVMRSVASSTPPLRRLRVPAQPDICLWASPDSFELFKAKGTSSSHIVKVFSVITGYTSMLSSDGAQHRHRRKASGRPFTPQGLTMTGVSAVISEVVEARVSNIMRKSEVNLLEEAQILALEIIFRVMGIPKGELEAWAKNYNTMLGAVIGPKWSLPGFPHHRALKARAWVDERLSEYVEKARQDPHAEGLIAELVRGRDDEGQALSDEEIFDNLRLMILAGHETTASVITWMASYAATHPEVHERLREEASQGEGLPQSPKDLASYPYTAAVFREALRLHPPAFIATRLLTEPMVIEGYALPKGTVVGIPIWLLCRDPSTHQEPERFMPERWMGDDRRLTPIETSAFGGGQHFCLGYHMALVEGVQFILALMRGLDRSKRRLQMKALPQESYLPLLRPQGRDTRCLFSPLKGA